MAKTKTSVVIACYNCEKTIGLCLKSVLLNKPNEVIVVNDCSNDNSLRVIKKFPVKLISLKERSGVSKAEKTGIDSTNGDVIFLTNADIVVPPNWIEKHLELHKKADCVGGWARYDVEPAINKNIVALPAFNCSFKRSVLKKIGNLDENLLSGSEDVEFFLRAKSHGFKLVSDSFIPTLHYHFQSYRDQIKKNWDYGFRLGKIMRKYRHGRLMNKWFLLLPIYWIAIFLKDLKNLIKPWFLKVVESIAKFIGFIVG